MIDEHLRSQLGQVSFEAEQQAKAIEVRPMDMNEHGERYAVIGGNVSQLPEHAWKLVRTEAFKEWFGDWEHIPVSRFKTAHGSIYSYDELGKTSRFKAATNESHSTQDATFFADMKLDEQQDFLAVMYADESKVRPDGKKLSVRLGEKLPDGSGKIVNAKHEIQNPHGLAIAVLNGKNNNGTFVKEHVKQARRVTLQPAVGLHAFDTRKYQDQDGQWMRELHLGNKITEIEYAESNVSKILEKGEPRLLDDPRNPGAKCFIKAVNPYITDSTSFRPWAEQFSTGIGRRDAMMSALRDAGYDGVLLDGQPVLEGTSGQLLFEDDQIFPVAA